jgi:clan AA aspartic protease
VVVENPFAGRAFPAGGTVVAVLDTGYEGFLAVPAATFHALALDELRGYQRTLVLANGASLSTQGAYGTLEIPTASVRLEETLVGTDALARLSIRLDYCAKRLHVERCS